MRSTMTISLPDDVRAEIDRVSRTEGVSRSDIVRESIRDYLFVRRFRSLRRSMVAKAARRGVHTDQDVFDRVS
jgi:metal-responsive CopG/Arc/MetJ family transcriptional regulator